MANATRPPKIVSLTTSETFTSFTNWQQTLLYTLGLDNRFAPYINDGLGWEDGESDNHGFVDDIVEMVVDENEQQVPNPDQHAQSAMEKVRILHLMLGQIANYLQRYSSPSNHI